MHIGDLNRDAAGRLLRSGMTDYERWLQFVSFQDGTQCWMWTGGITSSGHGNFRIKLADGWKQIGAHVYSYIHHHGPVPIGENGKPLVIRHSCDIRPCVNPNHLLPGTQKQNMQDMIARNRGRMQFGRPERDDYCPF
jgi:hypothetical protein